MTEHLHHLLKCLHCYLQCLQSFSLPLRQILHLTLSTMILICQILVVTTVRLMICKLKSLCLCIYVYMYIKSMYVYIDIGKICDYVKCNWVTWLKHVWRLKCFIKMFETWKMIDINVSNSSMENMTRRDTLIMNIQC